MHPSNAECLCCAGVQRLAISNSDQWCDVVRIVFHYVFAEILQVCDSPKLKIDLALHSLSNGELSDLISNLGWFSEKFPGSQDD